VVKSASSNAEYLKVNPQSGAYPEHRSAVDVPWSPMPARAIFLVGFMACGKTTTGRQLAHRLNWDFVDLDAEIESHEGQTIAEIFRLRGEHGEKGYRKAETQALRRLTESLQRDTVIALGGGTFSLAKNRELLRPWASVFLEAPVEELWRRSQEDPAKRPLRKDNFEEFRALHDQRLPSYRQATVTIVTSGRDPSSLCAEIESILQFQGNARVPGIDQIPPAHLRTGESE
jgi:shikimate kinase